MRAFSESREFLDLNVGFAIDESMPRDNPKTFVGFYGERTTRRKLLYVFYNIYIFTKLPTIYYFYWGLISLV